MQVRCGVRHAAARAEVGVVCQGPTELVLPHGVLGGTGSFRPGCPSDPKCDSIGTPEDFMFF